MSKIPKSAVKYFHIIPLENIEAIIREELGEIRDKWFAAGFEVDIQFDVTKLEKEKTEKPASGKKNKK